MRALVGMLLFVSLGCASVGVTRIKVAPPKPDNCVLDIYTSEAEIKRPWEPLCLLDAQSGSTAFADKTVAGAVNEARPAACKCGADALLIVLASSEGASVSGWGEGFAMLKAIRYTPASNTPVQSESPK